MARHLQHMDDQFNDRHFEREIMVLCVRWYLRFKLSLRDPAEMMAEGGFSRPTPQSCVGFSWRA